VLAVRPVSAKVVAVRPGAETCVQVVSGFCRSTRYSVTLPVDAVQLIVIDVAA